MLFTFKLKSLLLIFKDWEPWLKNLDPNFKFKKICLHENMNEKINMPLLRKHSSTSFEATSVCQVRGGHSVQWQVGAGEPSRERCLQADGRGGHEHPGQSEQGWLEVHTQTALTDDLILVHPGEITFCPDTVIEVKSFFLLCVLLIVQGAEGFGHRDGYVHRHVMPLSADQDHEECPDTDTQVRMQPWLLTSSNIHVQ